MFRPLMVFLSLMSFSFAQHFTAKSIYGVDNRQDVLLSPIDQYQVWAKSTLAMFDKRFIGMAYGSSRAILYSMSLGDAFNLCPTERFINQPSAASCSGFLISENEVLTAGHCITNQDDCDNNYWVFDYETHAEDVDGVELKSSNIYSCKKLSKRVFEEEGTDYALIELDRPVLDRSPLILRKSGTISDSDELVVIGSPSGLPLKVAEGGFVRDNSHPGYFSTNLDTFGGNSGSAVINKKTGEVEGILVRGDEDYVLDKQRQCHVTFMCAMDSCEGEDVTRITEIYK